MTGVGVERREKNINLWEWNHWIYAKRFFFVALLDSLTKSKQSANDHSQPKESSNLGSQKRTEDFASANGEAGGDASKGYTQDQVDAVKR